MPQVFQRSNYISAFCTVARNVVKQTFDLSDNFGCLAMRYLRPDRTRTWACTCLRSGTLVCCLLSVCLAGAESVYDFVYQETLSGLAWMQNLRRWARYAGFKPSFQLNTTKCGCAVSYTRSRRSSIRRSKQAFFSGQTQCNNSMCYISVGIVGNLQWVQGQVVAQHSGSSWKLCTSLTSIHMPSMALLPLLVQERRHALLCAQTWMLCQSR